MRVGHQLDAGNLTRRSAGCAERTALLSLGDSQCRFAVEETDDALHGYTDALDTRFIEAKGDRFE